MTKFIHNNFEYKAIVRVRLNQPQWYKTPDSNTIFSNNVIKSSFRRDSML